MDSLRSTIKEGCGTTKRFETSYKGKAMIGD